MENQVLLTIDGQVQRPAKFGLDQLKGIDARWQVADVTALGAKRPGGAVRLVGLLELVSPLADVRFITLHASADDFHASVPLDAVRDQALLIYHAGGQPLPASAGGPLRFWLPDVAACKTAEVDECASVKFVDRIELSIARGHDNRPQDEQDHAELHRRQEQDG